MLRSHKVLSRKLYILLDYLQLLNMGGIGRCSLLPDLHVLMKIITMIYSNMSARTGWPCSQGVWWGRREEQSPQRAWHEVFKLFKPA